jgi:hypothetical protein
MKLKKATLTIQRAVRAFAQYRHTQYVIINLMKVVYDGPESPLRQRRKKSKTAKDFMSKYNAIDAQHGHVFTDTQLSASKEMLKSLARVDNMNRRTKRLLKLTDLDLSERQKAEFQFKKGKAGPRLELGMRTLEKDLVKGSPLHIRLADYVRHEHHKHIRQHIHDFRVSVNLWEKG